MRKPREELVKRGVLLEDPEQGESAPELLLRLSVFCVAHLPLPAPPPCSPPSRGGKFKGSYLLTWFLSVCLALLLHLAGKAALLVRKMSQKKSSAWLGHLPAASGCPACPSPPCPSCACPGPATPSRPVPLRHIWAQHLWLVPITH